MKRNYELKPTTTTEKVGRYTLRGVVYSAIFVAGMYIGHSCDMSKIKQYSISDAEKSLKKTERTVDREKDSFLKGVEERIERLRR